MPIVKKILKNFLKEYGKKKGKSYYMGWEKKHHSLYKKSLRTARRHHDKIIKHLKSLTK